MGEPGRVWFCTEVVLAVLPDLLPMSPYLRQMVWGGRRLAQMYGKPLPPGKPVGESFELSAYPGRESVVAAGPLAGCNLRELVRRHGAELVGARAWDRYAGRFPLLIKLLDAQQNLSVQVHPDDAYARRHALEDGGKMEAWFVLHSEDGHVACGLQPGVDRQALARAIEQNEVESLIRFHPVQAGDVLFMPPGTVHALCRGVVLYEVQQSSDVTFRIYDYGRKGLDGQPRELHIKQALEVIDFAASLPGPRRWQDLPDAQSDQALLVDCEHFQLNLYRSRSRTARHAAQGSFLALTVVEGAATVSGSSPGPAFQTHDAKAGTTLLIPSNREFSLDPCGETGCTYLMASAGPAPPNAS